MIPPIPHIRVLWRPEQFTRIANPGFETNTTGWSVAAGINEAGTSITRTTADAHSGTACGLLTVTSGASGTYGVNFDLGTERFDREDQYGTTYAAVVWLKLSASDGHPLWSLVLGSEGTVADRATLVCRVSQVWQSFRVLWRPTASRTDVQLAIMQHKRIDLT